MRDWNDRRVLITGATGGVGEALARALRSRGAELLLTGRRALQLERLATELEATSIVTSLDNPEGRAALVLAARDFGADTVFHNAAIQRTLDFASPTPELAALARQELEVDLIAPITLTAEMIPGLVSAAREGRGGAVVFISSGLALAPKEAAPAYCAAKAGLRSFARTLSYQLERTAAPMTAHEVILPMVDTPMTEGRGRRKMAPEAAARQILEGVARGQLEVYVGPARALRWIWRVAPWLAYRMLRGASASA